MVSCLQVCSHGTLGPLSTGSNYLICPGMQVDWRWYGRQGWENHSRPHYGIDGDFRGPHDAPCF